MTISSMYRSFMPTFVRTSNPTASKPSIQPQFGMALAEADKVEVDGLATSIPIKQIYSYAVDIVSSASLRGGTNTTIWPLNKAILEALVEVTKAIGNNQPELLTDEELSRLGALMVERLTRANIKARTELLTVVHMIKQAEEETGDTEINHALIGPVVAVVKSRAKKCDDDTQAKIAEILGE